MRAVVFPYCGGLWTVAELAAEAGVSAKTMWARLRLCRMSPADAVTHRLGTTRLRKGRVASKYWFRGQQRTIKEICTITGRSNTWVTSRIDGAHFIERAGRKGGARA